MSWRRDNVSHSRPRNRRRRVIALWRHRCVASVQNDGNRIMGVWWQTTNNQEIWWNIFFRKTHLHLEFHGILVANLVLLVVSNPPLSQEFTYPYASPLDELRAADKVRCQPHKPRCWHFCIPWLALLGNIMVEFRPPVHFLRSQGSQLQGAMSVRCIYFFSFLNGCVWKSGIPPANMWISSQDMMISHKIWRYPISDPNSRGRSTCPSLESWQS